MNQPLKRFGDDIWIADGPIVRTFFVPFPTRMVVVKLGDGSLWVDSPVEVSPETLARIEAIGPVRYLVAPRPLHTWRLEQGCELFPEAQLWGPRNGSRSFARRVFARLFSGVPRALRGIAFTGTLQNAPPAAWADDLDQLVFKGNALLEEAAFLHGKSRTLILADFIQNYPAMPRDFFGNLAKSAGGVLNGGVPRDIRWSFTNRKLGRASFERLLSWDFDKLIIAHGACVERDAKAFVRNAFRFSGYSYCS
ncbi:MAG TPA: DUF4336 domain-containing protein [Candidatus Tyrphobacter sp.]